jgi:hypothetical protein
MITSINEFRRLNEESYFGPDPDSITPTPEQRFHSAIYSYYMNRDDYQFKKSTREEFDSRLRDLLQRKDTIKFNYKYRLADRKDVWKGRNNRVLGEVWYDGELESYWINSDLKK